MAIVDEDHYVVTVRKIDREFSKIFREIMEEEDTVAGFEYPRTTNAQMIDKKQ